MALNKGQLALSQKLAERIIEITYPTVGEMTEEQRKDRQLVDAARKVGGCATENLIDLLELVVGHKLPRFSADGEVVKLFPAGTALVLMANTNSHDYKIGSTTVVYRSDYDYGVKPTGRVGNHLPFNNMEEWERNGRLATPDEIKDFCDNLIANTTVSMGDMLMFKPELSAEAKEFFKRIRFFDEGGEDE